VYIRPSGLRRMNLSDTFDIIIRSLVPVTEPHGQYL
jgi:hypothetical protein